MFKKQIFIFVGLLFFSWCEARAEDPGVAATLTPSAEPRKWVLLIENPQLWSRPNGEDRLAAVTIPALSQVTAIEEKTAGDEHVPWVKLKISDTTAWIPQAYLTPIPLEIDPKSLSKIGNEPVDRYHGIPSDYVPPDLVHLPKSFAYEADRTYSLRREPADALKKMINAAAKESIEIKVVSAYRAYAVQRELYLKKIHNKNWMETTVAKPGHSEHQLGTAVDLTDGNEKTLLESGFAESPTAKWLLAHAPEYGFAISYTAANTKRTGYSSEPWHYRYYGIEAAAKHHAEAQKE